MVVMLKEKTMSKQAVVLDTIKNTKGKGGMTSAQLKLADAQAEDYADMKQELKEVKQKVEVVDEKVDNVELRLTKIEGNLEILLENSRTKNKLIESKYFWATIMLILLLIAGIGNLEVILKFFGG